MLGILHLKRIPYWKYVCKGHWELGSSGMPSLWGDGTINQYCVHEDRDEVVTAVEMGVVVEVEWE